MWGQGGAHTPSLRMSGNENLCLQDVSLWSWVPCVAEGIHLPSLPPVGSHAPHCRLFGLSLGPGGLRKSWQGSSVTQTDSGGGKGHVPRARTKPLPTVFKEVPYALDVRKGAKRE